MTQRDATDLTMSDVLRFAKHLSNLRACQRAISTLVRHSPRYVHAGDVGFLGGVAGYLDEQIAVALQELRATLDPQA